MEAPPPPPALGPAMRHTAFAVCYVISCSTNRDAKFSVVASLWELGLCADVQRVRAPDAARVGVCPKQANALAHTLALQHFASEGIASAAGKRSAVGAIFEDDVLFEPRAAEALARLWPARPSRARVFKLGCGGDAARVRCRDYDADTRNASVWVDARADACNLGTHFYAFEKGGALEMLENAAAFSRDDLKNDGEQIVLGPAVSRAAVLPLRVDAVAPSDALRAAWRKRVNAGGNEFAQCGLGLQASTGNPSSIQGKRCENRPNAKRARRFAGELLKGEHTQRVHHAPRGSKPDFLRTPETMQADPARDKLLRESEFASVLAQSPAPKRAPPARRAPQGGRRPRRRAPRRPSA